MLVSVCGVVETKRKKADGTIALAVAPQSIKALRAPDAPAAITAANADVDMEPLLTGRVVQLLLTGDTQRTPFCDWMDIMPLVTAGAHIEANAIYDGCTGEATGPSSRVKLSTVSVSVRRVAAVPDSVERVAAAARAHSGEDSASAQFRQYLSILIRPSSQWGALSGADEEQAATLWMRCLRSLEEGSTPVRQHCRLMSEYRFESSSRNKPRKDVIDVSDFKRPPRTRVRKATHRERRIIADLQRVAAAAAAQEAALGGRLCLACGPAEEAMGETMERPAGCSTEPDALNLPGGDGSMASSRGGLSRGEYLHGKKEPQVQWVVRRLMEMAGAAGRPVRVVDVGGGRGDLAVSIAAELRARGWGGSAVTVVDRNRSSLRAGRDFAERMGVLSSITFVEADFNIYSESFSKDSDDIDLIVVALHACGDLTDAALEFARQHRASFVCVPCCFSKVFRPEWRGGWSSFIPTAAACPPPGSEEDPEPIAYDRQTLGRLAESEPRECSWATMHAINTLRLCSVLLPHDETEHKISTAASSSSCSSSTSSSGSEKAWRLTLEAFSRSYSMRNMVLCGEFS